MTSAMAVASSGVSGDVSDDVPVASSEKARKDFMAATVVTGHVASGETTRKGFTAPKVATSATVPVASSFRSREKDEEMRGKIGYLRVENLEIAGESSRSPWGGCDTPLSVPSLSLSLSLSLLSRSPFSWFPATTSPAHFAVKEVDMGLVANLGTLQRLPKIVGFGNAMDLALTAKAMGLVSRVFARPGKDGRGHLRTGQGWGTKAVIMKSRDMAVENGLDYVATWNAGMLRSRGPGGSQCSQAPKKRKPNFSKM
ncbi:uncharacterized protein LOC120261736 [Dioscorea cayenensis subsp. rotundata]|uniref:Uncharacterized protein LOC120261736 n=1 Tax=Dioscorea cayennensis subsp. rotundata TaxID=55577 RepID=A0AB40BF89_DIOCR|nr:uncharacterized protein LOC120261736 [Dioscorea cayenensis subsp. rotundata]